MVTGKYGNFIRSTLRHSKWQVAAIALLLTIAAALIHIVLFLSVDYQQNFLREKERLNGEDMDLLLWSLGTEEDLTGELKKTLGAMESIRQYEVDRGIAAPGSVEYKDSALNDNIFCIRYADAMNKQVGKYDILESSDIEGVYLSYIFQRDAGYKIGDMLTVTLGTTPYEFRIAGFYNNIDTGTGNCTDIALILTDDTFESVAAKNTPSYRLGVILHNPAEAKKFEAQFEKEVIKKFPSLTILGGSTYHRLLKSRYVIATIFEAIVSVAAVLMTGVILATIAITLSNYIRQNIRTLGTLKAMGYRSRDLILPIVGEFALMAFLTSLIGLAVSYLLMPTLNEVLERQVGIPYTIRFMPGPAIVTVFICILTAAVSAFLSVLRIRRIYPIHAIREVRSEKKRRHNYFPLEKTPIGLQTALSLKSMVTGKANNIILFLSMTVIAFLLGFAAFTYQNVILDQNAIFDLICGQRTDSVLTIRTEAEEKLLSALRQNHSVERYYLYSDFSLSPVNLSKLRVSVVDDSYELLPGMHLSGRMPKNDSEIMLNRAYAMENNLKAGDKIRIEADEDIVEYTITGFLQNAYHSGQDSFLTREGYNRITTPVYMNYYVDLKDGTDMDAFHAEIGASCPLMQSMDYGKHIDAVSGSYIEMLVLASIVVVLLSFLIAAFILYILLSVLLSNKRREHGILKAIGFVTGDILFQTVFCNLPACLLGTVLGLGLARNGAGALLATTLNNLGVFAFGKPTAFIYLFICGAALLLFIILFSLIMAASIRKITPHELFNKE